MKRNNISRYNYIIIFNLFGISLLLGCVKDVAFKELRSNCSEGVEINTTFAEVKNIYVDGVVEIQEDLIMEGYIVSSDKEGNFFGTLHLQDRHSNPTEGFQMDIDLRDSHLFYENGSKVFVKLKGLYLGMSKGAFKIGGVFIAFGNLTIGRLPVAKVGEHLFRSCDAIVAIQPTPTTINMLENSMISTLVQLNNLEIIEEEIGLSFALPQEVTERRLKDCDDNELILLNSGFSDFQAENLPAGNGTLTAVLIKDNKDFQLVISDLKDIDFANERCAEIQDEFTSPNIFISELADPNNNTGARFVELYNSNKELMSLKGWKLRRYTNDNAQVSSTIDLSGFSIAAESTFVISPKVMEFETVYGFAPDLAVKTNSPADSNGDDNLELVDPFGTVIDAFGKIGEDGSGTDHEFEDGRAVRRAEISRGNMTYVASEWLVYNDTGGSGTVNLPQNAPEDFTPGTR